jgi:hypothetical protein
MISKVVIASGHTPPLPLHPHTLHNVLFRRKATSYIPIRPHGLPRLFPPSVLPRLLVRSAKGTTGSVTVPETKRLRLPEQEDRLEAALFHELTSLPITVLQIRINLHLPYHHVSNFLRPIVLLCLITDGPIIPAKLLCLLVQTLLLRILGFLHHMRTLTKPRNSRKTSKRK